MVHQERMKWIVSQLLIWGSLWVHSRGDLILNDELLQIPRYCDWLWLGFSILALTHQIIRVFCACFLLSCNTSLQLTSGVSEVRCGSGVRFSLRLMNWVRGWRLAFQMLLKPLRRGAVIVAMLMLPCLSRCNAMRQIRWSLSTSCDRDSDCRK